MRCGVLQATYKPCVQSFLHQRVGGVYSVAVSNSFRLVGSMNSRGAGTTHCAQPNEKDGSKDIGDVAWRAKLSASEYRVLRQKATDPRGGYYDDFFGDGTYVCAGCNTPLYTSAMKFACGCGWPGFWDCLPKAVIEEPDADGRRTEILCNACNGHLGHIFRGEGFSNPPPNERHCVNSSSIRFIPKNPA